MKTSERLIKRMFRVFGLEVRRIWRPRHFSSTTSTGAREGDRLDVGCGDNPRPGYMGCDIRIGPNIQVACKAWEVSKHFSNLEEVYSRHALEHLSIYEVEITLADWLRALRPGGRVHVVVPDLDYHIKQWLEVEWDDSGWDYGPARNAFCGLYGWQRDTDTDPDDPECADPSNRYWDVHKSGFNEKSLAFFLKRAGFENVECSRTEDGHLNGTGRKPGKGK